MQWHVLLLSMWHKFEILQVMRNVTKKIGLTFFMKEEKIFKFSFNQIIV